MISMSIRLVVVMECRERTLAIGSMLFACGVTRLEYLVSKSMASGFGSPPADW